MTGRDPVAVILKPVDRGWAVALTDGREVVRFTGLGAKCRATRYLRNQGARHVG
jgi:hypothetical protein